MRDRATARDGPCTAADMARGYKRGSQRDQKRPAQMNKRAAELGALGRTRTPSLLIRRDQLGFAGFLTCADFHDIASSGSRIPDFSGFPLAGSLAACGLMS